MSKQIKQCTDFNELQKIIPNIIPNILIDEKDITRICHACKKPYKDKQIVVNGFAAVKYPLCTNCRKPISAIVVNV